MFVAGSRKRGPAVESLLMDSPQKPVVFFDGVCAMCNGLVNFLLKADRQQRLLFAPLQGPTAQQLLPPLSDKSAEWSMLYVDADGVRDKSDAALAVGRQLGGIWSLLSMLARLVPRFIRDAVYRFIARNRYSWFGKKDACRIPTPEERERFLP